MQTQGVHILLSSDFTPAVLLVVKGLSTPQLMFGHDDAFNTEQIRSSNTPDLKNSIGITTPHPPSRYPIGLTQLALGQEKNVRITSYIDNVKFVESNETFDAIVHLDAWSDTILYSAACTWLPIPKLDREFQHGRKTFTSEQPAHKINFDQEFTSTPTIVVWFKALDIERGTGWHVTLETASVTTKGFILKCLTWGSMKLHSSEVTWIGFPASRPTIDSGSFITYEIREWNNFQHTHSKTVKFSKKFTRAPRVYFALRRIDSKNTSDLHLKAYVTDVTAQQMTLHLDSWEDLNMCSTEGQWIAIQDL